MFAGVRKFFEAGRSDVLRLGLENAAARKNRPVYRCRHVTQSDNNGYEIITGFVRVRKWALDNASDVKTRPEKSAKKKIMSLQT